MTDTEIQQMRYDLQESRIEVLRLLKENQQLADSCGAMQKMLNVAMKPAPKDAIQS